MSTNAIRDTIELAKLHEQQYRHLAKLFDQTVINNMHFAIRLPEGDATSSLVTFVIAYISQVPVCIDTARTIAREAKILDYTGPYLRLAEEFFLKPPEIVAGHIGLEELMDEAYLAHRLLEEVNDRFMARTSVPLIPVDMTMANLIVHSLIGEPFSNELDEAVSYMVERNILRESVYDSAEFKAFVEKHRADNTEGEQPDWPCLTDQLSINLDFAYLSRL